jgi:hypothetical protein
MDARSLLRAKKAESRVEHPHAAYTGAGQLRCSICAIPGTLFFPTSHNKLMYSETMGRTPPYETASSIRHEREAIPKFYEIKETGGGYWFQFEETKDRGSSQEFNSPSWILLGWWAHDSPR